MSHFPAVFQVLCQFQKTVSLFGGFLCCLQLLLCGRCGVITLHDRDHQTSRSNLRTCPGNSCGGRRPSETSLSTSCVPGLPLASGARPWPPRLIFPRRCRNRRLLAISLSSGLPTFALCVREPLRLHEAHVTSI